MSDQFLGAAPAAGDCDTILYVAYHPGALPAFRRFHREYGGEARSILVQLEHPYLNKEIVGLFEGQFDAFSTLPDVSYALTIRGIQDFRATSRRLADWLRALPWDVGRLYVVSECSAYAGSNAVLSALKRIGAVEFISLRERASATTLREARRHGYAVRLNVARTLLLLALCLLVRAHPVVFDQKWRYLFLRPPQTRRYQYVPAFQLTADSGSMHDDGEVMFLPLEPRKRPAGSSQAEILIFGDTEVYDRYPCDLTEGEFRSRLRCFFEKLFGYYDGLKVLYKPHPQDGSSVMPELSGLPVDVYKGGLQTPMLLELEGERFRSCYSISSSSLLDAAFRGIPSYSLYSYLGMTGASPGALFETPVAASCPHLMALTHVGQIGTIDDVDQEPVAGSV